MNQLCLAVSVPRSDARRKRLKNLPYDAILFLRKAGWTVERRTQRLHHVRKGPTAADLVNDEELRQIAIVAGWRA